MFYLQHGHGKSQKIEECAAGGNVQGVILSPGHEDIGTLADTVRRSRALGLRVLLDPQSYIYALAPQGQLRYHAAHGLDFTHLRWSLSASEMADLISSVADANGAAGVEAPWICPAPFHRSLTDYWMPAGVQLTRTAVEEWGGSLIATIAIDESTLGDWDRVAEWMDVLTSLDVSGFYLLVSRRGAVYPPAPWDQLNLSNLLRLIHTLAVVNQYEVIWGYADVDGLLGVAAGANAVASGWSYGLRQFSVDRYNQQRGGGAPAVPRIYIPRLISDLRHNEADDVFHLAGGRGLFPLTTQAEFSGRRFDSLSNPEAQSRHLASLAEEVAELSAISHLGSRLDRMTEKIDEALTGLATLRSAGIELEPRYAARLSIYRDALPVFRQAVGL
jgi:hypothetical protein